MVLTAQLTVGGQRLMLLAGGPSDFQFNESVSFVIETDDQAETDRLWELLGADGGEPGPCGWIKDRFGLSWQVVPHRLTEMYESGNRDGARRAMQAMLKMQKLDIAALEAAFNGR
jgi:predicted 3-demethylubiquinone-9 3-methyltransferase (glyoxalase superfamily)